MTGDNPRDFYEVGREYYMIDPLTKKQMPIMVEIVGHVAMVTDPRTGREAWAQPTNISGSHFGEEFTIWALKGSLVPVERPSGEAKIFSKFVK